MNLFGGIALLIYIEYKSGPRLSLYRIRLIKISNKVAILFMNYLIHKERSVYKDLAL